MQGPISRYFHPTQIIAFSFATVITLGTVLLSLPIATRSGIPLPITDALFTATSATCVTGLVVVDTGSTFSTFGQIVILACIQIGGLGLMTFTSIFMVAFGRRISIMGRVAIQESFHHSTTRQIVVLIRYIVIATLIIEAVAAVLLTIYWSMQGRFATFGETLYQAIFHSISAFCNAGFSLFADNFLSFSNDYFVQIVATTLIIVGGLGFLVGLDVKEYLRQALKRYRVSHDPNVSNVGREAPKPRLMVHTKFVLVTTLALLLVGTVSYYVLERRGLFQDMTVSQAWMNSFFCSVTPRTAGFNTVDYARMSGAGLLCTMVLMFIGASPGSTGGGIKTSTFGLLIAYSISRWRGHTRLHAFSRTVPQESIDRAGAVVVAAIALVILASSALVAVETYGSSYEQSQERFLGLLFETLSAFGTVGLSMGETPGLTTPGKLIVTIVMFMGRIGPLTLALAISLRQLKAQYHYAEENVMVG